VFHKSDLRLSGNLGLTYSRCPFVSIVLLLLPSLSALVNYLFHTSSRKLSTFQSSCNSLSSRFLSSFPKLSIRHSLWGFLTCTWLVFSDLRCYVHAQPSTSNPEDRELPLVRPVLNMSSTSDYQNRMRPLAHLSMWSGEAKSPHSTSGENLQMAPKIIVKKIIYSYFWDLHLWPGLIHVLFLLLFCFLFHFFKNATLECSGLSDLCSGCFTFKHRPRDRPF
jgi:hypothetical protein